MPRRRENQSEQASQPRPADCSDAAQPRMIPGRVLVVSDRRRVSAAIKQALDGHAIAVETASSVRRAISHTQKNQIDVAIIDADVEGGRGGELSASLNDAHDALRTILVMDEPTTDDAVSAMRSGACDLIAGGTPAGELRRRVADAAIRAEAIRRKLERVGKLTNLCKRLNNARQEVSGQVGSLCNDLVEAYRDLSDQIDDVSVAGELNALLRQELEVETLLRTMLEYLLAKVGPTNAAIFLPSSSGEFSLGAYVNYNQPKDSADVLLDQLADTLAPRFENQLEVAVLDTPGRLHAAIGDDARWLGEVNMLAVACHHEGECLGVLVLFRDEAKEYTDESVRLVSIASRLFAAQLGRVIRIHHRHLPEHDWGWFDEPDDQIDDDGLDDLDGYDDYGLAA